METTTLDQASSKELNITGNWTYFIGFYYIFIGLLILTTGIYFVANKDSSLLFVNYLGASSNVIQFLQDANMWLVLLLTLMSAVVVFINGFYLIKFKNNEVAFFLSEDEQKLSAALKSLEYYLKLNSFFTIILSIILPLAAIIYFSIG